MKNVMIIRNETLKEDIRTGRKEFLCRLEKKTNIRLSCRQVKTSTFLIEFSNQFFIYILSQITDK
ncbi:MAG TPA: hypothetical protein DEP67_09030 [Lachnospiraceae bacterium]|nr:hypothetical protein [Lachnospiraceae bacterium]